ncbi:hypothetical protein HK104_003271, partial [Borealophlyctis nickersoniae]
MSFARYEPAQRPSNTVAARSTTTAPINNTTTTNPNSSFIDRSEFYTPPRGSTPVLLTEPIVDEETGYPAPTDTVHPSHTETHYYHYTPHRYSTLIDAYMYTPT